MHKSSDTVTSLSFHTNTQKLNFRKKKNQLWRSLWHHFQIVSHSVTFPKVSTGRQFGEIRKSGSRKKKKKERGIYAHNYTPGLFALKPHKRTTREEYWVHIYLANHKIFTFRLSQQRRAHMNHMVWASKYRHCISVAVKLVTVVHVF